MAKKSDYNSDYMSRKQDAELEQMEKNLSALYADASKEVQRDFDKFTETFKKQQVQKQKELEEGLITDAEYQIWMQKQVLHTDMYKATISKLTDTMVKADKASMALINGKLPSVVAESYNFAQALGWASAKKSGLNMGTFQVYNARSVQSLMKGSKIMRDVDVPEDEKWNRDKINKAITTSLLKGDSISKTADALQAVANMDRNSAIRNARTCMTGAENLGRSEAVDDLKAKGIPVNFVWSCVHDARTRETHILLDGTIRDDNGYFGADILDVPLRYPADPDGEPEEIYNCRCRASLELEGIDHSNDDDLYKQFMMEHDPDSYEAFKDKDAEKEQAFQAHKEIAEQRLAERQAEKSSESGNYTEIPEMPKRPRRDDFESDEAYQDAKAQYKEDKEEYIRQRDEYIENLKNNTDPMSREEFEKWAGKHDVGIIENLAWDNITKIDDADPRLLRLLTDRYDKLFEQFPDILTFRQEQFERMGEQGTFRFEIGYSTNGYGAEATHGFVFGKMGNDFNLFIGDHYDGIADGKFTNATDAVNHIFDHEFGHNIQSLISVKSGISESEIGMLFYEKASGADGIKQYGMTNEAEFFAEAFATWSGGSKTGLAKQMEKFLKEYKLI